MRRSNTEFFSSARYSLFLLAAAIGGGCASRQPRVEAMVLRVDPAAQTMLVSHRAIEGKMPAMVMPLRVSRRHELAALTPGTRIDFRLRGGVAQRIRLVDTRSAGDFEFPHPAEELKPGEAAPDFSLTDQTGQPFTLSSYRGRVVVVNFLYTRCPLAEVCPRLAASFASLQRRFAAEMPANLMLVSITLDPTFDTSEVLARYAATMKARADGWRFLTGDTTPVARRFGLIHWAEEGVIVHNSQTAVIDRSGRLAAMVEGSSYRLEQLADLVKQTLGKGDTSKP